MLFLIIWIHHESRDDKYEHTTYSSGYDVNFFNHHSVYGDIKHFVYPECNFQDYKINAAVMNTPVADDLRRKSY